MRARCVPAVRLALIFLGVAGAIDELRGARQGDSTRRAFEAAAVEPERLFDASCVIYDRTTGLDCGRQAGELLRRTAFPLTDVQALTRHPSPRVRTLALADLFARGLPHVLPDISARVIDDDRTFQAPVPVARAFWEPVTFRDVPKADQTVGDVARALVDAYLKRAGYYYGATSDTSCPTFEAYWATRQRRVALASWLLVQLDRATQATSPLRAGRRAALDALRTRVEATRGDDRWWYTVVVGAEQGGEHVFSAAEVVQAGRALGSARLMAMLEGHEPASDPDLVPEPWPKSCGHGDVAAPMRRFVLAHARELLRPEDAEALVKVPREEPDRWAMAAASLRPDRAETILKAAMADTSAGMGWEQARMAVALVRIAGATHIPYALDWFYSQPDAQSRTTSQEIFLTDAAELGGPSGRALVAALVRDPRFARIGEPALRTLARHVNAWLSKAMVPDPEGYVGDADKAATFASWRTAIVQSVPRWR